MQAPEPGVVDAALVSRALALLEQGLAEDARAVLASALSAQAGGAPTDAADFEPPGDDEFDDAFDEARPETDSMIDADGIAFEAIRRARLDEPESVALPSPASPFHTRTMADLLEQQGDGDAARAIRSVLEQRLAAGDPDPAVAAGTATRDARVRTIEALERWLSRLRGGEA